MESLYSSIVAQSCFNVILLGFTTLYNFNRVRDSLSKVFDCGFWIRYCQGILSPRYTVSMIVTDLSSPTFLDYCEKSKLNNSMYKRRDKRVYL